MWVGGFGGPEVPSDGDRSTSHMRRWWLWAVVAVLGAALAIWWVLIPWSWSMIDDPGFVVSIRAAIEEHGFLQGLISHSVDMAQGDVAWGLFRPAYWLYPSFVYWLPIGAAHLVRLFLLVVAISGPLVVLRRRGAEWRVLTVAGAVMLSGATTLMFGLFNVSLQELSGAAFVGLGLWMRGPWARIALWTVAAWFKSPFAWLLVGQAIVLWRVGRRRAALASAGLAAVTLLTAAVMARGGGYTGAYASDRVLSVVMANLSLLVDPNLIVPMVLTAWWLVLTRQRPVLDSAGVALGVGFVGYTLQMLPWGVSGHYQGGIAYLLTGFLALLLTDAYAVSRARLRLAVLIPVLVATPIAVLSVWSVLEKNARFRGLTECLVAHPNGSFIVSKSFGVEASDRLAQNARLSDPGWAGVVVFEDAPLTEAASGDLLVVSSAEADSLGPNMLSVCDAPGAAVVRAP